MLDSGAPDLFSGSVDTSLGVRETDDPALLLLHRPNTGSSDSSPCQKERIQLHRCPVCHSDIGASHMAREALQGTGEQFLYFECSDCGCLSLVDATENHRPWLRPHVSMMPAPRPSTLRKLLTALQISPFGSLFGSARQVELETLRRLRVRKDMSVLDVSCESETLVGNLRALGYDAQRMDPYLSSSFDDVFDFQGPGESQRPTAHKQYDLILFRHSLECMPVDTLRIARERLKPNGCCVASIFLLGWAWKRYGTDWIHLNAPRHLAIHSLKSLTRLVQNSGFRIHRVIFDSNESQFWASDSLQRNIPLNQMEPPKRTHLARMRQLANDLNLQRQGDTAHVYLLPV
jgi:hypothetical protein